MWKDGNIHVWILAVSKWATGTADEVFNLLKLCAFKCLTNKVSATHNSCVRINDRIGYLGQSFPFSFHFFTRLAAVYFDSFGINWTHDGPCPVGC